MIRWVQPLVGQASWRSTQAIVHGRGTFILALRDQVEHLVETANGVERTTVVEQAWKTVPSASVTDALMPGAPSGGHSCRTVVVLHIAAPPKVVFSFLTDPAKHPRWMGRRAARDAPPSGIYRCEVNDTHTMIGEFVLVEPPQQGCVRVGIRGKRRGAAGQQYCQHYADPDA